MEEILPALLSSTKFWLGLAFGVTFDEIGRKLLRERTEIGIGSSESGSDGGRPGGGGSDDGHDGVE